MSSTIDINTTIKAGTIDSDNNLGFKSYASFGKNEITERIAVLVDLVKLVWNDDMFM